MRIRLVKSNDLKLGIPTQLKHDVMNAFNVLRERGHMPDDAVYAFTRVKGNLRVQVWVPDYRTGGTKGGVGTIDPKDLLSAAGPLPIIRGVGEFF